MPELPLLNGVGPLERVFSRPSWADPAFMLSTSDYEEQVVTIIAGTPFTIIAPDPKRWCIGFVDISAVLAGCSVAPFNDRGFAQKAITRDWTANWYTIFQYGPIVQAQWFGRSNVLGEILVLTNKISV